MSDVQTHYNGNGLLPIITCLKRYRLLILASGAGLLCGLSSPGPGLWPLAWVGLSPVFYLLLHHKALKKRDALLWGLCFGAAFHAVYMSWLLALHPMAWLGLGSALSLLTAGAAWLIMIISGGIGFGLLFLILAWLIKSLQNKLPSALFVLLTLIAFPTVWVLWFECYQLNAFWIPWALLDYTQMGLPLMRALVSISGSSHSVGWVLVFSNLLFAFGLPAFFEGAAFKSQCLQYSKHARTISIFLMLLFALTWLSGKLITGTANHKPNNLPLAVAGYQGGVEIGVIKTGKQLETESEKAYLQPLELARYSKGQLVVLPEEGIVPEWVDEAAVFKSPSLKRLQALCESRGIAILTGLGSYREVVLPNGERISKAYNATVLLQQGSSPQFYNKTRLVPMGETVPYLTPSLANALLKSWHIPYQFVFESGNNQRPLHLKSPHSKPLKIGSLICFELLYPELSRIYRKQGVSLLVNSSNLGWFHNHFWLNEQFVAIGQARAAENQTPLVISANTGPTAIILKDGRILRRSKSAQQAWVFSWETPKANSKKAFDGSTT